MAYVGWVPTANGRLSFRHIGETRKRSFLRYANTIDNAHNRVVIGVEKRLLSDLLFRRATELLTGRSGAFWFVLDCYSSSTRVGNIDALEGTVRIFKPQKLKKLFGDQKFFGTLKALQQHHIGLRTIDNVELFAREAMKATVPLSDIEVDFVLFRDGEIRMQEPTFADAALACASESFAKKKRSIVSTVGC